MKVLVIIVSYNFERWMKPCLDSLRRSQLPVTTVVIDNCSTDGTVAHLRTAYPEVRLIANRENAGFGRANNQGFRIAMEEQFDYTFLLNQDAWVDPDTLGTLVQASIAHPDYGILSPIHLTANRLHIDSGFPVHKMPAPDEPKATVHEIPFVNAAMWLIPVAVLLKMGGFSPLYHHYGEDVDFAHRLRRQGFRIGYCPVFGCHDREARVVTKPMEHRGKSVYLLTVFSDVSLPAATAFAKSVGGGVQLIVRSLLHGEWESAAFYTRFTFGLLRRTPGILHIRRLTRHAGPHFIVEENPKA